MPVYAKSNCLVEIWRAVLDGKIQHTLREHAGNWHKNILFFVGIQRGAKSTTYVGPFQILHAKRPTSPLSILKSSWTYEKHFPDQLGSVTNYLNDLKI